MCEETYKTSFICVDSYENSILAGRIFNLYVGADIPFRSTIEFINETEALMQELQYPQSFHECRTFNPKPEQHSLPVAAVAGTVKRGLLATFSLTIMFRQNTTWQGTLFWMEKNKELHFRSVLELLMMIDNAIAA